MTRPPLPVLCVCVVVLGAVGFGAEIAAATRPGRYAIVVGYNGAPHDRGKPLAYADDDAVRWAELLRMAVDDVTLLMAPDPATLARLGRDDLDYRAPTLENITAAFEAYNEPGAHILYVHASHGGEDKETRGGLVYVMLQGNDGAGQRLFQRDLRRTMVDRLKPDARLDVIIDACYAYHLLVPRVMGDDLDDLDARLAASAAAEDLSTNPSVGYIAATVGFQEVAETSALNGSFFSHIVRTGLLGAADADGSGVVEYGEMSSYLSQHQRIPKAHRAEDFHAAIRPPGGNPARSLVDWRGRSARAAVLRIGRGSSGRVSLHSAGSGAYASFAKHADHVVWLRVPPYRLFTVIPGDGEEPRSFTARPGDVLSAGSLTGAVIPDSTLRSSEDALRGITYRGLLHCKVHEGYALASGWPFAGCPDDWTPASGAERRLRLEATYRLADAPFAGGALSHAAELGLTHPVRPYLHLVLLGRFEATAGLAAASRRSEQVGGALGAGLAVPFVPLAGLGSLEARAVAGWAPLRVRHADDRTEQFLSDTFVQTELTLRLGSSTIQGRLGGGLELDLRALDNGNLGADPRWFVSAGVVVSLL